MKKCYFGFRVTNADGFAINLNQTAVIHCPVSPTPAQETVRSRSETRTKLKGRVWQSQIIASKFP